MLITTDYMYHKTINQHSIPAANHEKCNSSLVAMKAQISVVFTSANRGPNFHCRNEKDGSKLMGGGKKKQVKWEKHVLYI